jgi:hypothetical protein
MPPAKKTKTTRSKKSKAKRTAIKDLKVPESEMRKVTGGLPIIQRKPGSPKLG